MATFTNIATLSYNGNVTNSNVVTGTINEVLTASKTAVTDSYTDGDKITYVISLINGGNSPLTNVTVEDDLGVYLVDDTALVPLDYTEGSLRYFINGVLQSVPPTVTLGTSLVISGVTVPANGNTTLVYEAIANSYAPLESGSQITNTVTVTGDSITSVEASETITVRDAADLSITKALSPTTVTDNSQLTYTFVIQNLGNTAVEAGSDIILSDTFDPVLSNLSVTLNGTPFDAYSYDETTGLFTTNEGSLTVPAATYTRRENGVIVTDPGVSTLVITGTI